MLEVLKVSTTDILPIILILLFFKLTRTTGILFILFLLFFHRSPSIKKSIAFNDREEFDNIFTSPAYGKIVMVKSNYIQIFLNIYDIHFQFAPCECVVKERVVKKGGYFPAFTNKSDTNSRVVTTYSTRFGDIQIKQTSGTFAHKIISFGKIGTRFQRGEKIGFIRFGSRVDFCLPLNSTILVQKGSKVRGPFTSVAIFNE